MMGTKVVDEAPGLPEQVLFGDNAHHLTFRVGDGRPPIPFSAISRFASPIVASSLTVVILRHDVPDPHRPLPYA